MVNRVAMVALVVVFGAGGWLIAAPFVLRFQPSGAHWTGASRMDVLVGAVLAVAGFAGFFVALAGRVREMYQDSRR
ncbi:MAG TPA: hypothetical protein VFB06_09940 [Streptosporangiaceae bacterium]|nr:hypothetical protein [Streptosporangiaceae bacterium]